MNTDQVQDFISQTKREITPANLQSRCVDGRSPENENDNRMPAIAKAGGDVGDVMAGFGALNHLGKQLASEQVVDSVKEAIGGSANFKFHTDTHAEETGMGCGHIYQSTLHWADYGLTPEQTEFIKQTLPGLLTEGAKQVKLTGNHSEQAVIVVDSEYFWVKPNYKQGDQETQAFIYHMTLHHQQLDRLAKILTAKVKATGQEVEETEFRKALGEIVDKQLEATLRLLKAESKRRYLVSIDQTGEVDAKLLTH